MHGHARTMGAEGATMTTTLKDPVCGMDLDPQTAADKSEYQGMVYYFCCSGCKKSFEKQPGKYIRQAATAATHACC
jgi:Cu+-exporting ATPase